MWSDGYKRWFCTQSREFQIKPVVDTLKAEDSSLKTVVANLQK